MFKSFAYSLLYHAARLLLGAIPWQTLLAEVDRVMNDATLSGDEKFATVMTAVLAQGVTLKRSLLNFGIETAYQYLRRTAL